MQIDRVQGLVGNLGVKAPCNCATTISITLSGEQTIDGYACTATDNGGLGTRVLVKNQATLADNGVYYCNTTAWQRAPDFDGQRDVSQGTRIFVTSGTINANSEWEVTTANPVIVGTSALTFTQYNVVVLASNIHAAPAKTVLVDADEFGFWGSVSQTLNKITWANIVATLTTAFNALYPTLVNLLAGTGSALVGFQHSLAGTGPTTLQARGRNETYLTDFYANGVSGALVDPTGVVDSTAGIQLALNCISLGFTVKIPPGKFKISAGLTIGTGSSSAVSSVNNVVVAGAGSGRADSMTGPQDGATQFLWYGVAGGTMLTLNGPISGIQLKDFVLDCRSLANTGLDIEHAFLSEFSNIICRSYKGYPYIIQAYGAVAGCAIGANSNLWRNVFAENPASGGSGLLVGAADGTLLDVAKNTWIGCEFIADGASVKDALTLRYCDNLVFIETIFSQQGGSSSWGITVAPPPSTPSFPGNISFYQCPIIGPTRVSGSAWTGSRGLGFFPLLTGDYPTIPTAAGSWGFTDKGVHFGPTAGVPYQFFSKASSLSTTATEYIPLSGWTAPQTAEFYAWVHAAVAGNIFTFTVTLDTAPGGTTARTFTIRNTTFDTVATVTITGTATTATWTGSLPVAAGDALSIKSTIASGVPAASYVSFTTRIRETTY